MDSSTGLPVAATDSSSGRWVMSALAILYSAQPMSSSASTAGRSNGVAKKVMPSSAHAWAMSP